MTNYFFLLEPGNSLVLVTIRRRGPKGWRALLLRHGVHQNGLGQGMFILRQATHYVQDLNTPFHCIKDGKGIHEDFGKAATEVYWQKESYKGFYYIKDYQLFASNCSER